jgi:hypothetical protein
MTTDPVAAFRKRIAQEPEFCEELFRYATVRLLAFKYAYYVLSEEIVKDVTYDLEEKQWFIMGTALGHLKLDETSPCVDWNPDHPLAAEGIALARKLMR